MHSPRRNAHLIGALTLSIIVLISICSLAPAAQSGRRPPKQPKSPDPFPPKSEEPPIKTSAEQNSNPQIPVKIVSFISDISVSSFYSRFVEEGCLEQLSRAGAVKASPSRDLNRKQAIDIAKGSSDTYVLWYQLEADMIDRSRGMTASDPQYLTVSYEVFTPGTGKSKTSGRVYQRPQGPGRMPIPGPGTPASAEYSLRYAGREMADRLLDTLNLAHPPDRR